MQEEHQNKDPKHLNRIVRLTRHLGIRILKMN